MEAACPFENGITTADDKVALKGMLVVQYVPPWIELAVNWRRMDCS